MDIAWTAQVGVRILDTGAVIERWIALFSQEVLVHHAVSRVNFFEALSHQHDESNAQIRFSTDHHAEMLLQLADVDFDSAHGATGIRLRNVERKYFNVLLPFSDKKIE